jgi:hypothetical protein
MPARLGFYPFTVHTRHDDLCAHVRGEIDSRPVPEERASRSVEESLFLVPTWTYIPVFSGKWSHQTPTSPPNNPMLQPTPHAPTRSAAGSPTAHASPFPAQFSCAAFPRTGEKNLLCCSAAVLIFFIAGLFISCASSVSIIWEPTASRRRSPFPRLPQVTTLLPGGVPTLFQTKDEACG